MTVSTVAVTAARALWPTQPDGLIPPLINWPGGKRKLLGALLPHFPTQPEEYFEPFFGGAAVFLSLRPQRAVLSDTNLELVNMYQQVRDNPQALIRLLHKYSNSEKAYYAVRASRPRSPLTRAVRLLYLTRLAFNDVDLLVALTVAHLRKTTTLIVEAAR